MVISTLPNEVKSLISSAKFRGAPEAAPSSFTSGRTALKLDTTHSVNSDDSQWVNAGYRAENYSMASFSLSSNCCLSSCFASLRSCSDAENLYQTTTFTAVNISYKPTLRFIWVSFTSMVLKNSSLVSSACLNSRSFCFKPKKKMCANIKKKKN